ncbi:TerB family tellurite resistance protein [Xanthobacter autotrophicus]|uniref:tellurite resistance TerB family protein n=1 Tax=Xanthobacter autotrophicus TaxID=280 RepID=UPI003728F8D5
MVFGALKKAFKAGAKEVQADYSKNRDFLEAVCAASALVAYADGSIDDSERTKAVRILTSHQTLGKMYQQSEIEQVADTMFKRAKEASGRQALARELDDIKGREGGAQMAEDVYLVATDVAHADGNVDPAEVAMLDKIARRLDVDPAKFDF